MANRVTVVSDYTNELGEPLSLSCTKDKILTGTWMEYTDAFIESLNEIGFHVDNRMMAQYLTTAYGDRNWMPPYPREGK